jgi:hypothetical protein
VNSQLPHSLTRVVQRELELNIFRGIAILLPQLLILLDVGARLDFLFGFNRTDAGFSTLLLLLLLAPAITLIWFIVELIISIRVVKRQKSAISFRLPALAMLFFLESLGIDIYMVLHFKM